ncbi:hypothetical protein [Hahella ganghwensis]|uniref:hypothetical protein n=1 Tax=Hahella ganghwensis TaxID=286420 RepID=UPI0003723752|nr:hypothetical protein [Hahella ganghwensis]
MYLAPLNSPSLPKLVLALFIPLLAGTGCEEMENKPKTPLVLSDPFFLQGNSIGTEGSITNGEARVSVGYTAATAASTFLDALEQDHSGEFIPYRGIEWRYQSEKQYYSEKNASFRLMLPNKALTSFMTLNTQEVSLGLFVPIGDLPDSEVIEVTPPDLTSGEYTCISMEDQLDGDGEPIAESPIEIHSYTARFVNDGSLSLSKTTPGTGDPDKVLEYDFTDNKVLTVTDEEPDKDLAEVFASVLDNSCDKIRLVDESDTEYSFVPYPMWKTVPSRSRLLVEPLKMEVLYTFPGWPMSSV